MIVPFDVDPEATAEEARATLTRAGWRLIGVGDWAWVYESPDRAMAARVTPIDPAYRLFAEASLAAPRNRWLPEFFAVAPLRRAGYVAFLERLWPADAAMAAAFCAALGLACDSVGPNRPFRQSATPAPFTGDAEMAVARGFVEALSAEGAARFALWGGLDVRPGNVMADARGWPRLVDPLFVAGPRVIEAIQRGERERLAGFARGELEDFLTIPAFAPGPGTEALRAALAALA